MFIRKLQAAVVWAGLMSGSLLLAHDAKLHAGKATEGEIVSITGDTILMKTSTGNVRVTLQKDTKFEMGTQTVDVKHFKKGDKIRVIGTKLATGELAAKELLMGTTPDKSSQHAEGKH